MEKYGYTLDGRYQLYHETPCNNDGDEFVLFASHATIEIVKQHVTDRKYLMDGTFRTAPRNFYQLLTISIEFQNEVSFNFMINVFRSFLDDNFPIINSFHNFKLTADISAVLCLDEAEENHQL